VMGPFRPIGAELEGKDPQLLRLVIIHWVRRGSYGRADRTSIARNMDGGGYRSPGGKGLFGIVGVGNVCASSRFLAVDLKVEKLKTLGETVGQGTLWRGQVSQIHSSDMDRDKVQLGSV
jgi:hypothetical protein